MDYIARHRKLQEQLLELQLDGYLVTQNVDLYYLTGSMQAGYLFVPASGDAKYYVRRSVSRAQEESACETVALGSFRNFGTKLAEDYPQTFEENKAIKLATEFDVLPVQLYQRLQKVIPQVDWVDGSTMMRELRMVKDDEEIRRIKRAAQATNIAFTHALTQLREGMTEVELIQCIENVLREQGHLGIMRMRGYNQELITGFVASGAAAAQPTYFDGPAGGRGLSAASPQGPSNKAIRRDEPILIDIGCCIDGYVIDQTRTVVIGELPDDLKLAYELSEKILQETESKLNPGTICEQLYFEALSQAKAAGMEQHFMGYGDDQVKFLGHGIGLEIDEFPVLARGFNYPLEPGMVIAIEPKFTYPNRGVVGIENSYVITDSGFEKLTTSQEGLISIK